VGERRLGAEVAGVTDRRSVAPHRRAPRAFSRLTERSTVLAYRAGTFAIGHAPQALARGVVGTGAQASYLLWPSRRRASNLNFARILGREPDDPVVRRLALRAYRHYARYLVELMRLPTRPPEDVVAMTDASSIDDLEADWRASGKGLIVVAAHIGNNEAIAAGLAHRGWPISGLADDSSFPELLALLTREREAWGIKTINWQSIREIFGVLRRKEILVLLVDWGYRSDDIPVRLFGRWTTLPAGPVALAARSGAVVSFLAGRRTLDGRYALAHEVPFTVPADDPATLQRATQAIADALERAIRAAPEQWHAFKPMWPDDPAEEVELARRAAEMLGEPVALDGDELAPGTTPARTKTITPAEAGA
jgi:KDO2-lipid IV(A) lauroyltransferase